MSKSLSSSSHSFISNTAKLVIFVIGNIQSFTSQIFGVVSLLGENLDFFSPLRFDTQKNSDYETPKIKLYLVRAFKRYLNDKSLIHDRVTPTISKFSP